MLTGWLALALVLTAFVLWLAGVVGRWWRLEETYWVPCFEYGTCPAGGGLRPCGYWRER